MIKSLESVLQSSKYMCAVLFVSVVVFTQSWPGSYSSVDVYYSVPVISTWSWTVFLYVSVSQASKSDESFIEHANYNNRPSKTKNKKKTKKPTVKISHMWTPFSVKREYFWKLENSPVTYTQLEILFTSLIHIWTDRWRELRFLSTWFNSWFCGLAHK